MILCKRDFDKPPNLSYAYIMDIGTEDVVPEPSEAGEVEAPAHDNNRPKDPEGPSDKEPLIRIAEQSVREFFDQSSSSSRRIRESSRDLTRFGGRLAGAEHTTAEVSGQLRSHEDHDGQIGELTHIVRQVQQKLHEQVEAVGERSAGGLELLDFVDEQEHSWIAGGGLEQLTADLRVAANEPNLEKRAGMLAALKDRVVQLAQRVDNGAKDQLSKTRSLESSLRDERGGVSGRIGHVIDEARRLRERFPESYHRIAGRMEEVGVTSSGFYNGVAEPLQDMSMQYNTLSRAAESLGVNITQVFALIEKEPA